MNAAGEVVQQLGAKGIEVFVEGGVLKAKARKGALDPDTVHLIRHHKRDLLDYLSRSRVGETSRNIEPTARTGRIPPSFAQQRLWLLDQLDGGSAHYNIPGVWRVRGKFDVAIAEQALRRIIERHEPLRTVFSSDGDDLWQIVRSGDPFAITAIDLRGLDAASRDQTVRDLAQADAQAPFDLARELMLRASYLALGDAEGVLLLSVHHIASDGWSMGVFVREFVAQYQALAEGAPDPLTPLTIHYGDFAQWQRRWLTGPVLQEQLEYWRRQLAALPAVHGLPLDRPRPARKRFEGARYRFSVGAPVRAGLTAIAHGNQATLFMVLHAALNVLLARHGGGDDIVIGTPVANRLQPELEDMIGFFVNTLVLRTDVSGNPRFTELLERVKRVDLEAQGRQDVPFDYLVEALNPERSPQYTPLFQILLAMGTDPAPLNLGEAELVEEQGDAAPAKYELLFEVRESSTGLACHVDYDVALFDRVTIERLAARYVRLLEAIVATPDSRVHGLPMLSDAESRALLLDCHVTADFPRDSGIHELFEAQVRRTPDHVALVCGAARLSYRELNARANRLAHALRLRGVAQERLVGLCVERGLDMLVGLLGILKAGGAYLPLDPAYPRERLDFMIGDAQPVLLLTHRSQCHLLPDTVPALLLDEENALGAESEDDLVPTGTSSRLAYVIYTSGSTGRPKGVMVEHRGLCNLAASQSMFAVTPESRVLGFASLSFDAAAFEWIMALLHGASFHVCTEAQRQDPVALQSLLCSQAITHATLPPAVLPQIDSAAPHAMRCLVLAGEAFDREIARPWLAVCRVFNAYGPTESTIWASTALLRDEEPVTIGRPIPNARIYLLSHGVPVPRGVPGELCIGGAGVARGYLRRPELTAEKFVADPFDAQGERLYHTGDLARWLPNGDLEFLGRIDSQVKIRGFRIELGEIEGCLARHPGVRDAVVVTRDGAGEKRLVAYVTLRALEQPATVDELKSWLARQLPAHMMPAAWRVLGALPLTPNGKVDRAALPAADAGVTRVDRVAPRTEVEKTLAAIWARLLDVEADEIGVEDNFFALGGHSLLVVKLLSAMQTAGLAADAPMVFSAGNLAALAAAVTVGSVARGFSAPPNSIPGGCTRITPAMLPLVDLDQDEIDRVVSEVPGGAPNVEDIYPLAPLQEGIYFLHLMHPRSDPHVLSSVYSVETTAQLDALLDGLRACIARHEVLRTTIHSADLRAPVQVVRRVSPLSLEWLDAACADPGQLLELDLPMDLARGPLLRVTAVRVPGSERSHLRVDLHHVIADHVGLEIILSEIEAHLSGRAAALQAPVPYREFVAYALEQAKTNDASTFFGAMLGDVDEPTAPFDLREAHGDGTTVTEARVMLGAALAREIRRVARQRRIGPAVLFHAAWARVLAACSAREDVVFGTVLSGRLQGNASAGRALGLYVNTLPIRIALDGSVSALITRTDTLLRALLPYEHTPLSFAQRCSGLSGNAPLFIALLNFRHSGGEQARARAQGIELVSARERTNYPLVAMIDDLDDEFAITVQAVRCVAPARVAGYLEQVLAGLVRALEHDPDRNAMDLEVLPAAERAALLHFDATAPAPARDVCLHELFESRAALVPDAIAVSYEGEALTYRELNERANRLAHSLRARNVAADHVVGLFVERGLDLMIGVLGILKSGGAYLPLDPAYPRERLAFMLDDAAAKLVLTQESLRDALPATIPAMCLDRLPADVAAQPSEDPPRFGDPTTLAYVIYTSGSTGRPKGVMIEHAQVTRLFSAAERHFDFCERDVWSLFHSAAFDFSVWEMWGALLYGGTLVVVPQWTARSAPDFHELLRRERVTVLNQTPRSFAQLAAVDEQRRVPLALRYVIFGGEALNVASLAPWFARHGDESPQLVNMYGITETTVHVTHRRLRSSDASAAGNPSVIGRPLADLHARVLTSRGALAPIGVAGELHVGGAGVARGYLNRPELTAQRFVIDPCEDAANKRRLYRTGDLVRRMADGSLEYLGRIDDQVKIRGYRIELGEIESCLARHARVRAAVVVVREDAGDKRLVAYVTAAEPRPRIAELRAHLQESLPDYMVPAHILVIEALPLTANGKVDRRALPAPERELPGSPSTPPRTAAEKALAAIWCSVLGIGHVGLDDNFFELGGHSLLVVRMLADLQKAGFQTDVRSVYSAPTLAELADRLAASQPAAFIAPPNRIPPGCERITPDMLPLVELEQEEIDRIVAFVPGGAANVQDIYPLVPLQEGMHFYHLMHPARDPYVLPSLFTAETREQFDALLVALRRVVARHDALRTAILSNGLRAPVQVVQRAAELRVESLEPDGTGVARTRLEALFDQPLDIAVAPLLRVISAQDPGSPRVHFLFQAHHLVDDMTSMLMLGDEVRSYLSGGAVPATPVAAYRDFVAHALHEARNGDAKRFFRELLGDVDEPTAPFDLLDVHGDGSAVAEDRRTLGGSLAARVRSAAKQRRVSPAILFHAAWARVVGACSAREDVVFGTVLSGRLQGTAGAGNLVGLFVNTLPVRLKLATSVAGLVQQAESALRELLPFEHVPLSLAQRCSALDGNAPLFSALLNYRHSAGKSGGHATGDHGITLIEARERTNYPIAAMVDDLEDGFSITMQTATGIEPGRLSGFLERALEQLVRALECEPDAAALDIDVRSDAERAQQDAWNDTQHDFARDRTLHSLFEERARRVPDQVAVIFEGASLTYRELNERSNRLANYLRARGVGPDVRVAVCLERGFEMVVGLLGILKAGGAYVPVDPGYPAERIAWMIDNARPAWLLTQRSLAPALPAVPTLCLDSEWPRVAACDAADPPALATARDLAYVIYTSGSTGAPKGVMCEHAGVVNRLQWMQAAYELTAGDRVMQKTPFSFDVSVWEFFWPLLEGATLVVAKPHGHQDPHYLAALIERESITVLHFVPPMLEAFLAAADLGRCGSLRRVICSGQALPPALARRCLERLPTVDLHNLYGPTEASVDVSAFDCRAASDCVPIGRPIWNTQLHVLDEHLRPLPIGVAGELHIGGVCLARGYLDRPELTAERFVADPRGPLGARLYRTGDRARLLADGSVEYLGRLDHQVKIRGFRIEPGEIEDHLTRRGDVAAAVVAARTDGGDARLVAYITAKHGVPAPGAAELRESLQRALPEYMVPAHFVVLDALPLTANGKVDRKALPAPGAGAGLAEYAAPRSALEATLAEIWCAVLGVARVGLDDDFFALGGHSLLVVRMLSALQRAGLRTDVQTIYAAPKLRDLAARLAHPAPAESGLFAAPPNLIPAGCERITPEMLPLVELGQEEIERIVASVPGGAPNVQDIYPLAPLQEGMHFYHLMHRTNDPYVLPSLFTVESPEKFAALMAALHAVIARHDVLRTAILSEGLSQPVQVVYRRVELAVNEVEPDDSSGPEERLLRLFGKPMDLTHAPMLEVHVAREPGSPRIHALFRMHHLVDDVTSSILLGEEVQLHLRGAAERLPPPVSYREFVAHALHQARHNDAEEFFTNLLSDVTEPTAPFDWVNVHGDGTDIVEGRAELGADLAERVRRVARALRASPATLFHAAWARVVAACSGRDDVVFGTVLSGRLQGTEGAGRMLGMFINTLPMRVKLAGVDAAALVEQTASSLRALLPYEQTPLTRVQRCSGLEHGLPLFSAILNYRHTAPTAEMSDTAEHDIALISFKERTNYPMTVSVDDVGDGFMIDAHVFRSVDPQRVIAYLERSLTGLLDALEHEPTRAALDIDVLPAAERRLLAQWNHTAHSFDSDATLGRLFEAQAARSPTAIAVVCEGSTLTYGELEERANRLANYLRARGVGRDRIVGICVDRSLEMVVGLLGILKAGGAYLPLDPGYPRDRLAYMLDDAAPAMLLTQQSLVHLLPASAPTLRLDSDWPAVAAESSVRPECVTDARGLAYVIYTSGSTGRPKGVMTEHAGIVNRLQWMQAQYRLTAADRVLQKTPFSFDVSVWEFFWPLLEGARLVVAKPQGHQDPDYLAEVVEREAITTLHFVPPMLEVFLSVARLGQCGSLRQVMCSGQALPLELTRRFFMALPKVALHNLYGPTEASVDVSFFECRPESGLACVPIGRPIWNTHLYVLDAGLRPVPTGVAGELMIGGVCLARGYLNREELTGEKFIADPFSASPGARLYRTGDRARFLPDGNIEYLGRLDHQVKIRGFRIELGEIEALLRSRPEVRDAVVMARSDEPGEPRLVAYLHTDLERLAAELGPVTDHTAHWADIWNQIYGAPAAVADAEFDTVGWTSSYDREAIPAREMREWVASTVTRILALEPRNVLEIGCGTGLLLHRIAPRCERYFGTDISQVVIDKLDARLRARPAAGCDVRLLNLPAERVLDIDREFDTVILNSVAQYFTSFEYLRKVLAAAIATVGQEGRIFLGDLRHLGLHGVFRTSLALHRAAPHESLGTVRQSVARGLNRETELLIDPAYFHGLRIEYPRISRVEVLPKRGTALNEMTCYRYDVVISVGPPVPLHSPAWRPWNELGGLDDVEALLVRGETEVALRDVPHARVAGDVAAHGLLAGLGDEATVSQLHRALDAGRVRAVSLEQLEALAARHGCEVRMQAAAGALGTLHVVFTRSQRDIDWSALYPEPESPTNQPLPAEFHAMLQRSIVESLRCSLPDYMVPSHFVVLDRLPLTANGKVDRRALPAPDATLARSGYVAPRSEVEARIAVIWADLLHVDRVGVHDDFFELGGHSLLAIGLVGRMREAGMNTTVGALFEAPTVAGLARALGRESRRVEVPPNRIPTGATVITPEMLPLVDLTPQEIAAIVAAVPGGAANVQDIYPLAPLQEGILFHHLVQTRGDVYLLPTRLAFDQRARLDAFLAALQAVVARHDILRTAIAWEGLRNPVQVVWREARLRIEEFAADPAAGEVLAQLAARFDPARYRMDAREAPLLRCCIAHDPAHGRWLLQVVQHHFTADHATLEIIIAEIQALLADEGERLAAPVPFREFVAQARLGKSAQEHEAFFREMLGDVTGPTAPFDVVDLAGEWGALAKASQRIEPPLSQRLRRQTRRLGVSAASLMHLAWARVLARLTSRSEVVFGTVLFGRMHAGARVERAPGVFINTLPIRLDVGAQGVLQGLRETHERLLRLVEHEHAPLVLAQRSSGMGNDGPLFTTLLNYRHNTLGQTFGEHFVWRGIENLGTEEGTNYALTLTVDDFGDDFVLSMQVDARINAAAVCSYLQATIGNLVEALERAPQTRLDSIEVLPPAERERILIEWNRTAKDIAGVLPVHEQFAEQAQRNPDKTAVEFEGVALTYRELDERANRLAHCLRARGVGADTLVGLCLERGLEMVVGLLGILKAGGAYVPLDPAYPRERLEYMTADAAPLLVLTQESLIDALPSGAPIFCIDSQEQKIAAYPASAPAGSSTLANLAYVLYTSGSTGRPKGVCIEHGSLCNFLDAMRTAPGIAVDDVLLAVTSLSFDIAALEIWLPLSSGAATVIASRDAVADPARLVALLQRGDITVMQATPTTWRMLVDYGWSGASSVVVLCGGEALPAALAAQLLERASQVWNLYGPTETTIWSTVCRLERGAPVSIGRPISNTRLYVVDDGLVPVPTGIAGELLIGGMGVARGYLNRPELTAEKFINFPADPGERVYRTGDRVRQRADGVIEFHGRMDEQVKIRGHRIEPGEIETVLRLQPGVRDAVVIAREDVPGELRLVAYTAGASVEPAMLREAIALRLPEYMLPAHITVLDALPRTPNGKLDRRSLPVPDAVPAAVHVAPRTGTEARLLEIWARLLHLDGTRLGTDVEFFDVGGHSLLAIRLMAEIAHAFGVQLEIRELFGQSTIARTAALIDGIREMNSINARFESLPPAAADLEV